jgi:hypothetical protein
VTAASVAVRSCQGRGVKAAQCWEALRPSLRNTAWELGLVPGATPVLASPACFDAC